MKEKITPEIIKEKAKKYADHMTSKGLRGEVEWTATKDDFYTGALWIFNHYNVKEFIKQP